MKQVWLLNHYAAEPGGVGGTRHFHLAEGLRSEGWEASILAAGIELNSGRDRLAAGQRFGKDVLGGVTFLWLRVPPHEGNGVGRLLNMLAYSYRALLPSVTGGLPRPDVIVGSSVHPFAALAGALLAKRHRVPFVFEVRDLWPQTLIDLGRIKDTSLAAKMMRWLETWLYRKASRVVVLPPRAVDYIAPLGIDSDKVVWIPNGVDLSLFPPPSVESADAGGAPTLMYFGAHGDANGLDNVLRAMAELQRRNSSIRLRLIGDGPRKKSLQALAGELGLDNVAFEDPVPKSRIPALAAEADAFVFNLVDSPVFKYGISSNKLFDYLAAQRPIIFCCDSSNNPVEDAKAGITVAPGNPVALADAIERLASLPLDERRAMGQRGRRHVEENYGFERLARKFARVLDHCVGTGGPRQ